MVQNQEGMKEELEKLSEQAAEMHRREWNVCVCAWQKDTSSTSLNPRLQANVSAFGLHVD